MFAALLMAVPLLVSSCNDDEEDTIDPIPNGRETPDPEPEPETLGDPEYAILLYGHGGGNLDLSIFDNINELFHAEKDSYKKVKMAVQYKLSSTMGLTENECDIYFGKEGIQKHGSATLRFVVNSQKFDYDESILGDDVDEQTMIRNLQNFFKNNIDNVVYQSGEKNTRIADPNNLTDFIKWAVNECHAKKYVLIISDHGGGYMPHEELSSSPNTLSKALVYDDNNSVKIPGTDDVQMEHFTAQSLAKAISSAGGFRPEVLYLDACLMNTIEYQFELKDVADYLVLSSFTVPGDGGDYATLIDQLAKNQSIEAALTNFCKASVDYWDSDIDEETQQVVNSYSDMSIIRTSQIANFGSAWKDFTTRLITAYTSGDTKAKEAIDLITSETYSMSLGYPLYDMMYYAKKITQGVGEKYFDKSFASTLESAYKSTVVYSQASSELRKYGFEIGPSVLFGCNDHITVHSFPIDEETEDYVYDGCSTYNADGTMTIYDADFDQIEMKSWGGTFANTYKTMQFDIATGWSEWIKVNETEASPLSPADLMWDITNNGFVSNNEEPLVAKKK